MARGQDRLEARRPEDEHGVADEPLPVEVGRAQRVAEDPQSPTVLQQRVGTDVRALERRAATEVQHVVVELLQTADRGGRQAVRLRCALGRQRRLDRRTAGARARRQPPRPGPSGPRARAPGGASAPAAAPASAVRGVRQRCAATSPTTPTRTTPAQEQHRRPVEGPEVRRREGQVDGRSVGRPGRHLPPGRRQQPGVPHREERCCEEEEDGRRDSHAHDAEEGLEHRRPDRDGVEAEEPDDPQGTEGPEAAGSGDRRPDETQSRAENREQRRPDGTGPGNQPAGATAQGPREADQEAESDPQRAEQVDAGPGYLRVPARVHLSLDRRAVRGRAHLRGHVAREPGHVGVVHRRDVEDVLLRGDVHDEGGHGLSAADRTPRVRAAREHGRVHRVAVDAVQPVGQRLRHDRRALHGQGYVVRLDRAPPDLGEHQRRLQHEHRREDEPGGPG